MVHGHRDDWAGVAEAFAHDVHRDAPLENQANDLAELHAHAFLSGTCMPASSLGGGERPGLADFSLHLFSEDVQLADVIEGIDLDL